MLHEAETDDQPERQGKPARFDRKQCPAELSEKGSELNTRQFAPAGSVGEEVTDRCRDLTSMRFQREVAGVEEANNGVGNVALEGLRTRRQEKRIVLAPYGEEWRLVGAEVVLEGRIECDVALVVAEQIELDLVGAGRAR